MKLGSVSNIICFDRTVSSVFIYPLNLCGRISNTFLHCSEGHSAGGRAGAGMVPGPASLDRASNSEESPNLASASF